MSTKSGQHSGMRWSCAGGASRWCVLLSSGVSGTIHGTWWMERACSIARPPSCVHCCSLEVDGVAACWPFTWDIGSDGCHIDVLEANGTYLRLRRRCCCPLCYPVGWRLVGQVHLDWRACHSSTPYIWTSCLSAPVIREN